MDKDPAGINEDEIDTEALQAQIDLSMSFAQNLISSWVEPHKIPSSSRRKNLEQELTEYMKMPPRLGVGAAIPEGAQSMTRETARLKGKLAGSKRPLEEGHLSKSSSDDEGESRAVAIKKKARPDPFDVVHGKRRKKNKEEESESTVRPSIQLPPVEESKLDSSDEIESLLQVPGHRGDTPIEVKENLTNASHPKTPVAITHSLFSQIKTISPSPSDEQEKVSLAAQKSQSRKLPSKDLTIIDTSSIKTPRSNKGLPLELLKVPLLNLIGPPSDQGSEDESVTATPSAAAKKKRKRRKKKKNHTAPESTEIHNSLSQTTSTQ